MPSAWFVLLSTYFTHFLIPVLYTVSYQGLTLDLRPKVKEMSYSSYHNCFSLLDFGPLAQSQAGSHYLHYPYTLSCILLTTIQINLTIPYHVL